MDRGTNNTNAHSAASVINIQEDEEDSLALYPATLEMLHEYLSGPVVSLNQYMQTKFNYPTLIAHFHDMTISDIDFTNIDLSGVFFEKVIFTNTVRFDNTNLRGAYLFGSVFNGSNLTTSNLSHVSCDRETSFLHATLGRVQERDVSRRLELQLQRGGIGVVSLTAGIVASVTFGASTGGIGPIVLAGIVGAGTSYTANKLGNVLIDRNIDAESGVVNGKLGSVLSDIGVVKELAIGPATISAGSAGTAIVTRGLPFVPGIAGAVAIGGIIYAGYHSRGAIMEIHEGHRSPAAIVASEGSFVDELREDLEEVGGAVGVEAEQLGEMLDHIPFCHKLKNALIMGSIFTLMAGITLTGLALGHVINTDDLPTSATAMGASLLGGLIVTTSLGYCFSEITEGLLAVGGNIIRTIKCITSCGRIERATPTVAQLASRDIEQGISPRPQSILRNSIAHGGHVAALNMNRNVASGLEHVV